MNRNRIREFKIDFIFAIENKEFNFIRRSVV